MNKYFSDLENHTWALRLLFSLDKAVFPDIENWNWSQSTIPGKNCTKIDFGNTQLAKCWRKISFIVGNILENTYPLFDKLQVWKWIINDGDSEYKNKKLVTWHKMCIGRYSSFFSSRNSRIVFYPKTRNLFFRTPFSRRLLFLKNYLLLFIDFKIFNIRYITGFFSVIINFNN